MSQKVLWMEVLKRLKPTIKWAHFLTWFQNTAIIEKDDVRVVIGVPNAFAHNWIANKYNHKILQAFQEQDAGIKEVIYQVSGRLAEKDNHEVLDLKALFEEEAEKKVRKMPSSGEVKMIKGKNYCVYSQQLNPRYTLDSYIVGRDNRLPHAACCAVANMPGGIYNPLYVYGKVGLGKTHLLQAVGNGILKNFPDKVVKYITAEKFVTEVVEAIGKRYMHKFKEQYRNVDVFLLDDVQFFARKDSSQQEFFHTFNELYQRNKQIVISSDCPPSELDDLDDRLKSRFGMGMVVELLFPDFETRLAILNSKCQEFQVIVDPEVLSFIAQNIHNNIRELEGVLRQVIAESNLSHRVATIRSAAEVIKRLNKAQNIIGFDIENKRQSLMAKTALDIMIPVAKYYGITIEDLVGASRTRHIIVPRQVCMYLIRSELAESYEKIGSGFGGRNHTTVINACEKTVKKLKKDLKLVRDINAIKKEIGL